MDDSSKCPYCGEWIKAEAQKCRYCGEWLQGSEAAERNRIARERDAIYNYEWKRQNAINEYYQNKSYWGFVCLELLLISIGVGIFFSSWWYFGLCFIALVITLSIPYLRTILSLFYRHRPLSSLAVLCVGYFPP